MLDRIGLQVRPKTKVKDLSIGRQQLIEIARALSSHARIVIMDEPTSSLSGPETQKLFELIQPLKESNIAVIYISHRMEEIFLIADRVSVLRDGKYIETLEIQNVDKDALVALMVGRHVEDMYAERKQAQEQIIFEVEHLCREGFFEDINFFLKAGEILGVYGLVGAGRTELALSLFGYDSVDSGTIFIQGKQVRIKSPQNAIVHSKIEGHKRRRRTRFIIDIFETLLAFFGKEFNEEE